MKPIDQIWALVALVLLVTLVGTAAYVLGDMGGRP